MVEKKDLGKFTIGLNENDPAHQQVIELLNRQGRRKGQFIVNAVLHYIHCAETPDIPQAAPLAVDKRMIEEVVLRILKEQKKTNPVSGVQQEVSQRKDSEPESLQMETAEEVLEKDRIATIANTLAAFRNK